MLETMSARFPRVSVGANVYVGDGARVRPGAVLGADVYVGDKAIVGANVRIGDGATVRAGSVVENDADIGAGACIGEGGTIGEGAYIGPDAYLPGEALVRPGATIAVIYGRHVGNICPTRYGMHIRVGELVHSLDLWVTDGATIATAYEMGEWWEQVGKRMLAYLIEEARAYVELVVPTP